MNIPEELINKIVKTAVAATLAQLKPVDTEIYLHTQEAANYMRLSRRTLENWRYKGGGPRFMKFEGAVRYKKSDLDEFMVSRLRRNTAVA